VVVEDAEAIFRPKLNGLVIFYFYFPLSHFLLPDTTLEPRANKTAMAQEAEVPTKNGEALASKAGVRGKRGRPRGVVGEPPAKRVRRSETAPRRSTRVVKQTAEKEATRDAAKIVKKVQ
jgi:hypothetical protein